jgi:hypothetical protein
MSIETIIGVPTATLAFAGVVLSGIVGLVAVMHRRRIYHPHLVGALIGALLCFVLIEALPSLI